MRVVRQLHSCYAQAKHGCQARAANMMTSGALMHWCYAGVREFQVWAALLPLATLVHHQLRDSSICCKSMSATVPARDSSISDRTTRWVPLAFP